MLRSHLAVAAIGMALLGITLALAFFIRVRMDGLARVSAPMARDSLLALEGVEKTLAELQAWVTMADQESHIQRHLAWEKQIEPAMARLAALSQVGPSVERDRILETKRILSELKELRGGSRILP